MIFATRVTQVKVLTNLFLDSTGVAADAPPLTSARSFQLWMDYDTSNVTNENKENQTETQPEGANAQLVRPTVLRPRAATPVTASLPLPFRRPVWPVSTPGKQITCRLRKEHYSTSDAAALKPSFGVPPGAHCTAQQSQRYRRYPRATCQPARLVVQAPNCRWNPAP